MKNFLLILTLTLGIFYSCKTQPEKVRSASIIPQPLELTELGYYHKISENLSLFMNNENLAVVGEYLKNRIETSVANANISFSKEESDINFIINNTFDDKLGDEGYSLSVDKTIIIRANKPAGIFYGVQTLFQLLPPEIYGVSVSDFDLVLPAVKVVDNPRYSYRGMHLDPCRHFFSVEETKDYIDYLAYHKLNRFHWHLTEDQGWRIEIKKYPKLVEIGSKRNGTLILNHEVKWADQKYDTIPVEGYYTQEQIREIVEYAKERFIEVIPEIEMPGHALAALASYPELSCAGGPFEVLQKWGVSDDVYCAGNDSVFAFLHDVIEEVCELFPYDYIHIGGDECPKVRWEECKKCQKRMKDHELANEHELQSWFIAEMEKYINSKGKTLIGWSEIMEGGIAPNAVLQSWQGVEAGIEAAKQHHKVIMSPSQYLYFDGINVDRKYALMEPIGQKYCWTNIEKTYSFEPTPDTIPVEFQKYFIGAEATMWSEFISTDSHLEYMLLPRLSALSEICWTKKELKDFQNFSTRLNEQYLRYDQMEVNYRIPHPQIADTIYASVGDTIFIKNPSNVTEVRYTIDGNDPSEESQLYGSGLIIESEMVLKSRCYINDGRGSSIFTSMIFIK